jgi:hypothetical protein
VPKALREGHERIKLQEQEAEVMRRAVGNMRLKLDGSGPSESALPSLAVVGLLDPGDDRPS